MGCFHSRSATVDEKRMDPQQISMHTDTHIDNLKRNGNGVRIPSNHKKVQNLEELVSRTEGIKEMFEVSDKVSNEKWIINNFLKLLDILFFIQGGIIFVRNPGWRAVSEYHWPLLNFDFEGILEKVYSDHPMQIMCFDISISSEYQTYIVPMCGSDSNIIAFAIIRHASLNDFEKNAMFNIAQMVTQDYLSINENPLPHPFIIITAPDNRSEWKQIWASSSFKNHIQSYIDNFWDYFEEIRSDVSFPSAQPADKTNISTATRLLSAVKKGQIIHLDLMGKISLKGVFFVYTMTFERLYDAKYSVSPHAPIKTFDHNRQNTLNNIVIVTITNMIQKETSSNGNILSAPTTRLISATDNDCATLMTEINKSRVLGQGGYGIVYQVKWRDREWALKILEQPVIDFNNLFDSEQPISKLAITEAKIAKKLEHPNIVKTHHAVSVQEGQNIQTWILMDLCENGNLRKAIENEYFVDARKANFLEAHSSSTKKPHLVRIFACLLEIVDAMTYLHEKQILHGDLSANNILLTNDNHFKISDFGLSRSYIGKTCETQTYGTVAVMPPELLSQGSLSKKADVYAFGVLMYEMCSGHRAWGDKRHAQVINEKLKPTTMLYIPKDFPSVYQNLLSKCICFHYHDRLDFDQISKFLLDNKNVFLGQ